MSLQLELLKIVRRAAISLTDHIESCKVCTDEAGFCEEGKVLSENHKSVCARSRTLIGYPTKEEETSFE